MELDKTSSKVLAAGFNGFGQLKAGQLREDIVKFEAFPRDATTDREEGAARIFSASWSSTAVIRGKKLLSLGFQHFSTDSPIENSENELISPICDHNGLIGCLDTSSQTYYLTDKSPDLQSGERTSPLIRTSTTESPPISHLARANNERVAVTFKQAPNAKLTHITEFESIEAFRRWHDDPSGAANYPAAHHMLQGRPKQLLANAATFVLLVETGEVYTWGDPRFRTLARSTTGGKSVPAAEPGIVEALAGLKIEKIACGGWLGAALSEGAMYLWGASTPGGEGSIKCLKEAGTGEVVLVDIPDASGEPLDIVDVSIGNNHVALATENGKLFVVGDNRNGQLGLGIERAFVGDWTEVDLTVKVQAVYCGPKATFVTVS